MSYLTKLYATYRSFMAGRASYDARYKGQDVFVLDYDLNTEDKKGLVLFINSAGEIRFAPADEIHLINQ